MVKTKEASPPRGVIEITVQGCCKNQTVGMRVSAKYKGNPRKAKKKNPPLITETNRIKKSPQGDANLPA